MTILKHFSEYRSSPMRRPSGLSAFSHQSNFPIVFRHVNVHVFSWNLTRRLFDMHKIILRTLCWWSRKKIMEKRPDTAWSGLDNRSFRRSELDTVTLLINNNYATGSYLMSIAHAQTSEWMQKCHPLFRQRYSEHVLVCLANFTFWTPGRLAVVSASANGDPFK